MRRALPFMLIGLSVVILSCGEFLFSNPADPKGSDYQGYASTDDPAALSLVSPAEGTFFDDPAATSLTFTTSIVTSAQAYQLRFSATALAAETDIVFTSSESASNVISIPVSDALRGSRYWSARAKKADACTPSWTSPRTYPLIPAPPGEITINTGDGRLDIGWPVAPGATAYELWMSTGSEATQAEKTGDDLSESNISLTGLVNGTSYSVWVKAKNAAGITAFGPIAQGTPLAGPGAPMLVAGDGRLELSWSSVPGASSYEIWYGIANDSTTATQSPDKPTATTASLSGLTNGTMYYLWIRALNANGLTGFSPVAQGMPLGPVMAAPILVSGTSQQLSATWSAVPGASSYEVWYNTANTATGAEKFGTDISETTTTIAGLTDGTTYYVWVRAKNAYGTSNFGPSANGIPLPPPPAVPTGMTPADGSLIVDPSPLLDWSEVIDATGYEIQYATSEVAISSADSIAGSISEYQMASAMNLGDSLFWRVRAKDAYGTMSDWSSTCSFTIATSAGISIVQDPSDPITITMSGQKEVISSGETMTVSASTSVIVDSYQWYLNGSPIDGATTQSVDIGNALEAGNYRLSIVVRKGSVLSSAYWNFSFFSIPRDGLVGEWLFCGNANDTSQYLNNGTVQGASLTIDRFNSLNSAYYYNGSNNYIEISGSPYLNVSGTLTLSCWAYYLGQGKENGPILTKANSTYFQYGIGRYCTNGGNSWPYQYFAGLDTGGWTDYRADSTHALTDNTWYFLVTTYDRSYVKLYIDGVLVQSIASTAAIAGSDTGKLWIGGYPVNETGYTYGKIDDVRIYNRALSSLEIGTMYHEKGWAQ